MNPALYPLLTLWACILNAIYRPILKDYNDGGISLVISEGFGANYIVWFSLIIATGVLRKIPQKSASGLLFFALAIMLYPSATLSWLAASLVAIHLVRSCSGHIASYLLLATCIREPLTAISLKIFAGNILGLDALFTNAALMLMGQNAILQSNIVVTENGNPLLILTGCSVFANLSYMSLLWLSLHVFYKSSIGVKSWLILILSTCLTLISNSFRLAFMTKSQEAYFYYHDGLGSQLFEWGLMLSILFIVVGGCIYEKRR